MTYMSRPRPENETADLPEAPMKPLLFLENYFVNLFLNLSNL
jgi:hypothetical protein